MCLAIPGKVTAITGDAPYGRTARVDFGGISREVNLSLVPEADVGAYVLVHVGFAIGTVDEREALQVFEYLKEIEALDELTDGLHE